MLAVVGLTYQLIAAFLRNGGALTARGHMQQMAAIALSRLAGDLRGCARSGVSLESTQPVLGLARLEGLDTNGKQVWSTRVTLYSVQAQRLIRREVSPPGLSAERPTGLAPAALLAFAAEPGGLGLADGVETFEARWGANSSALTVSLALFRVSGPNRREEFQLSRDLSLRNSL